MLTDRAQRSDDRGRLECGCVISLVVSVREPYGKIRRCALHENALGIFEILVALTQGHADYAKENREYIPGLWALHFTLAKAVIAKVQPSAAVKGRGPGGRVS